MSQFSTFAFVLLAALSLISGCAKNDTDPGNDHTGNGRWVSGYYVAYDPVRDMCRLEEIDWSCLTHIVMGPLQVRSDGSLVFDFYWDDINGPLLALDIAQRAHAAGRKAILMLGGAGQGTAIRQATADHRDDFVSNLVAAMTDFGYDGLDLDWEDDVDWGLFLELVDDLRSALPAAILTLPVSVINPNIESVEPGIIQVAAQVDQVNLMSYYPSTAVVGSGWLSWHNSPLSGWKDNTPVTIEDSLARYTQAGIPKDKLGMGISFYAIGYSGGITGPNQSTESPDVSIQGGDNVFPLAMLFGSSGVFSSQYRQWDSQALEPYLSLPEPDPDFGCRYISFEDEESILEKGNFARQNGYGGIIVWNINQGYIRSGQNPTFLMQALKKAFID